jgi:hypothetical protein
MVKVIYTHELTYDVWVRDREGFSDLKPVSQYCTSEENASALIDIIKKYNKVLNNKFTLAKLETPKEGCIRTNLLFKRL